MVNNNNVNSGFL